MALNTEKQIKSIFYNNTEIPLAAGSSNGHSITFPATATNWNRTDNPVLVLADGTTKSIADYSSIAGQTIKNIIGIDCKSTNQYFVLKMTLSKGTIVQRQFLSGTTNEYYITTSPNATTTPYAAGSLLFWIPVSDIVLSSIQMYNTD